MNPHNLTRVDASRFDKVVRLGVQREPGWIYYLHSEANLVLRAPHDPLSRFRNIDDDAEPVAEIPGTLDRDDYVHALDSDGDVARMPYHIGFHFVLDADGASLELESVDLECQDSLRRSAGGRSMPLTR